jgi:hypothetical protein
VHKLFKNLPTFALCAAFSAPLLISGCAVHARIYDPYYHDYHDWNGETVYYNQWEHDTHRDHKDFKQRSPDEQKQYWDWRHHQDNQH